MTPKQVQEFEQSSALLADAFPPFWRRLYFNCVNEGFSQEQAMTLLTTYIKVSMGRPDPKGE